MPHNPTAPKHVPFIDQVREELSFNIGELERSFSTIAGAGLVGFGLTQPSWKRLLWVLIGGALLKRGITGHCDLYEQLHVNTRHHAPTSTGVESGRGTRIESSIEILCPAPELYRFWRQLDNLPRVLRHVESVEPRDGLHSHWTVRGPFGQRFDWDARIISDEENRLIAWESLPDSNLPNAGSVWFEQSDGGTRLKVAMEFEPPGKTIALTVAKLLGDSPQSELEEDLVAFKDFAERELTPASESQN